MAYLKLTDEERDALLKAIDEAEERILQHEGGFTVDNRPYWPSRAFR